MSLRADKRTLKLLFAAAVICTAFATTALLLVTADATAGATTTASKSKKKKKSTKKASIAKKLPSVTSIDPGTVAIGETLTIKGKNFTIGAKKMLVVFRRDGGKRYTAKGTATSRSEMTVVVPDVSNDLENGGATTFHLRLVNKYGMTKKATSGSKSPTVTPTSASDAAALDCDLDKVPNTVDTDDDNDMLSDTEESWLGTDQCLADTEGDGMTDYYEYKVALEFNGGPILPYPIRVMRPDPLASDAVVDYDGDGLPGLEEFKLWKFSSYRADRFYSDANHDSDNDTVTDDNEDEDADLLTNYVEYSVFVGTATLPPLSMISYDTDGDGLCDGLDDQEHDGAPTAVAAGDCTTAVPNNSVPGDPNPSLIDGDDNVYSNIGEVLAGTDPYNACDPNPASPTCALH